MTGVWKKLLSITGISNGLSFLGVSALLESDEPNTRLSREEKALTLNGYGEVQHLEYL
jgi:hypothetical protein